MVEEIWTKISVQNVPPSTYVQKDGEIEVEMSQSPLEAATFINLGSHSSGVRSRPRGGIGSFSEVRTLHMGLLDLTPDDTGGSVYRQYPDHERQDEIEAWAEEFQDRFPERVEFGFIEVSPQMESCDGRAFYKSDGAMYIRIAEFAVEEKPDWRIKTIILHEMLHIYFYQIGRKDVTERDPIFTWALGFIGADISKIGPGDEDFEVYKDFLLQ